MTLIGFSRKKLNERTALLAVLNVVTPRFGKTGFCFAINADSDSNEADEFSFDEGLKVLQRDSCLSFFKNGEVSVWLDNQAYNDRYWIYPHSTIEIALAADQQQGRGCSVQLSDWLEMAKGLVEAAGMDLVLFVGKKENTGDYLRTPLGFKIGLIKVYWIMCFGASYSKLIADKRESTSFHIREEFQNGAAKAFVSTPSFDSYLNLEPHVQAMQRMEIGQELFHRLPVEEKKDGESGWIFNPKFILRFLIYFFRQKTTNWAKYQAAVVPKN